LKDNGRNAEQKPGVKGISGGPDGKAGNFFTGIFQRKTIGKIIKFFDDFGLYLYALACGLAFGLGILGFYRYYKGTEFFALGNIIYSTLQLFTLKSGNFVDLRPHEYLIELEIARWLGGIVVFTAVGILLLKAFSGRIKNMLLRMTGGHVIVCGSGRIGSRFVKEFGKKYPIVIIENDKNSKSLEGLKYSGALVVYGNAMDPAILEKAGIRRAKYLIPALGDDGSNAEVAVQASKLVEKRDGEPLTCFVSILDHNLCDLLKVRELENDGNIRLEFFNVYDIGSRMILNQFPVFDESGKKQDDNPHMLIIGLGNMGESLIVRAAKRWWGNYQKNKKPLNITVIDVHAEKKLEALYARNSSLETICKIRPLDYNINCDKFIRAEFLNDTTMPPISSIFVCVMEDSYGLSTALLLNHRLGERRVPIIVRLNSDIGLSGLLSDEERTAGFENIYGFGLWDRTCKMDLVEHGTHEVIAQAIHESYFITQLRKGEKVYSRNTMTPWNELSEENKDGNREPADHVNVKMNSTLCGISRLDNWDEELFTFTPYEVVKLSRMEHERWMKFKISHGWRYEDRVDQDKVRKMHPDILSWDVPNEYNKILSDKEKKKDFEAVMDLPSILARVDLRIYRKNVDELLAKSLFMDKVEQEEKASKANSGAGRDDKSKSRWGQLSEDEKSEYIENAKALRAILKIFGYELTGRVSDEYPPEGFNAGELDQLRLKYGENQALAIEKLPAMLARSGMEMYNVEGQLAKYSKDLALLKEFMMRDRPMQAPVMNNVNAGSQK
jgi:hypothetical protein